MFGLNIIIELSCREIVTAEPTQVRGKCLRRNTPCESRVEVPSHRRRVPTGIAARRHRRSLHSVLHRRLVACVLLFGDVFRRLTQVRRGEDDEYGQSQSDHEPHDGDHPHQPRERGTQFVDVIAGPREPDHGDDCDEHHPEPDVSEEVAGHITHEMRKRVDPERGSSGRERRRYRSTLPVELLREQVRHDDPPRDEYVERRH